MKHVRNLSNISNLAKKKNNETMRKTTAKNKTSKNKYVKCQNTKKTSKQENKQSCGYICTQAENAKIQQCKKIASLIWHYTTKKNSNNTGI